MPALQCSSFWRMAFLGLSLTVVPRLADAAVIFSDFGPGDTYQVNNGWLVNGTDAPEAQGEFAPYMGFTAPGNYAVGEIDVALTNIGENNTAIVSLWTDVASLPGVELGSWSVSNQPTYESTDDMITSVTGITGIELVAGGNYFVNVGPGADDTNDVWNMNNQGVDGPFYDNGGFYPVGVPQQLSAFDVLSAGPSSPVPEPSSLLLFAVALIATKAALGSRARRTASSRRGA